MAGILHKTLKNIRNIITMGKLIGFELVIAVHKRARALLMCFKLQNYKIKHKVNKWIRKIRKIIEKKREFNLNKRVGICGICVLWAKMAKLNIY